MDALKEKIAIIIKPTSHVSGTHFGRAGKGTLIGPAADRPTQLQVNNVPANLRNFSKILGHFSQFGKVKAQHKRE